MTTLISVIQGDGDASSLVNQTVTVEARVTAWLPDLKTFYVQEELVDQDGNPLTSEGIAVYYGNATSPVDANSIGDIVRFDATVAEYFEQTQLTNITNFSQVMDGTAVDLDPAVVVNLPLANTETLERYEGMLIEVRAASDNPLYVADTYTYARYGELTLYADGVPEQYTQQNLPDVAGYAAYNDFLSRNRIQVEDWSSVQNPSLAQINAGPVSRDGAALSSDNFVRVGDQIDHVTGVLGFGFGQYELQPALPVDLVGSERPVAPDAAAINQNGTAEVRVASFNVLNYFVDYQVSGTTSDNFTTPAGTSHEPRGANNQAEFERQQAKIVEAIIGTGADALGLMEIQNNGFAEGSSALSDLVDALNTQAGAGTYDYIRAPYGTGDGTAATAGSDAIMVAMIYKPAVLQPLGAAMIPDSTTYTAFQDSHRVPVAQTFGYTDDSSKQFTLVVNHFKSKGSVSNNFAGDPDQLDGQGNNNPSRLQASVELSLWLDSNPTGATDGDYLVLGDLNSYRMEDPVRFLTGESFDVDANYGGYQLSEPAKSLAGQYQYLGSASDYGYVFNGLRGTLDHALARGLDSEVTGVTHWHINADEQIAMDYNLDFSTADFFAPGPYRASDHDPVIIGLRLDSEAGSPDGTLPLDTTAPTLLSSQPADDAVGIAPDAVIQLNLSEAIQAGTGSILIKNLSGGADLSIEINSASVTIVGSQLQVSLPSALDPASDYAIRIASGVIEDLAGNAFAGILQDDVLNFTTQAVVETSLLPVFINEIHYDNAGGDVGEATAVAGLAGTDLTGWSLVLYNGANGQAYDTRVLSGVIADQQDGYGEIVFSYPANGIQNGSPDGVALVNAAGEVVQFISYEGVITATNGVANGLTSLDIGVEETGTTPIGHSLQVVEVRANGEFVWAEAREASFGSVNLGQVFPAPAPISYLGTADADLLQGTDANEEFEGLAGDDQIRTGGGDDVAYGGLGEDQLIGGLGTEQLYGGDGNDILLGKSSDDQLFGGAGDDLLDGGFGKDWMEGGDGNDTYVVNTRGDGITELFNEGVDTVRSSISYRLGEHVENLSLTAANLTGTGNVLSNHMIAHASGSTLFGQGGDDLLQGGDGNDMLDGGLGKDQMVGGLGDDSYFVNTRGDHVIELADAGDDIVNSTISWTLGAHLEQLNLLGTADLNATGNDLDNLLMGNVGDNLLDGRVGNNQLHGGAGNDTYLLQRDYAVNTVHESVEATGGDDRIQFGQAIAADQVWFSQMGDDLHAQVIGTQAMMVIKDWYSLGESVEQFQLDDGLTLSAGAVQQLVDAMAAFVPPSMGQTQLNDEQQAALSGLIASSWAA
ncbi:MAG: ExeM/NucH family extracellular endonuclease [Pseudomonadota bacterium]|nr:ExeM/NucH family extracellular endonuclease [Pseudomonadota bacterium]